jgi:uncharacterized protein (DUF433 family)
MERNLIVCTRDICGGAPRLDGLRITVSDVVDTLSREPDLDSYLSAFPQVTKEQVVQAVNYCRLRICEKDKPEHYCHGCTLRTAQDGISFEEFRKTISCSEDEAVTLEPGSNVFLGSEEELYEKWKGIDGWKWADDLYIHLRRTGVMPA